MTIWLVDLSIHELDERFKFNIACTGNAGAWQGTLRIAGGIWLNLTTQESCGVRVGGYKR